MMRDEKEKLLEFFADHRQWCRDAEARDDTGQAVHYDDPAAVAWDITGGMCFLFGWQRALELFPQVERHVHQTRRGRRGLTDPGILAMATLQNFNDDTDTTFELIREWLTSMPVWDEQRQPT